MAVAEIEIENENENENEKRRNDGEICDTANNDCYYSSTAANARRRRVSAT